MDTEYKWSYKKTLKVFYAKAKEKYSSERSNGFYTVWADGRKKEERLDRITILYALPIIFESIKTLLIFMFQIHSLLYIY